MNTTDTTATRITGGTIFTGLTRHEQVCLTMGVADTGDPELDAIITKSNKQKLSGLAMQGLLAGSYCTSESQYHINGATTEAVNLANALLKLLEKNNEN
tara:strand:- start:300 stop:596 length:297 start_codon:yes stop_codon:yes gene_type:complete